MLRADYILVVSLLGIGLIAAESSALPPYVKSTHIAGGFTLPVFVTAPPGDTSRIFVVEQRGSNGTATRADIRIVNIPSNTINATPFFTITGLSTGNEEGLLGFAFHPDFFAAPGNINRGAFFVYYTSGGNNHVVRYTTIGQDPMANYNAASAQTVIDFNHPSNDNHNGGWIAFGPDRNLYIDTGDGGSSCDPPGNAQNINSYLGKMHRLNVDADQNGSTTIWGYVSPAGNPFIGVNGLDEIWLYGLRNPWRASFDRGTGNIYIGDVGQGAFEEVDIVSAGVGGLNLGWDIREGFACSTVSGCPSTCATGFYDPVYAYDHNSGGCAITGGYVYRGPNIPEIQGTYFFGDYCTVQIWTMPAGGGTVTEVSSQLDPSIEGINISNITSFGEDAAGEVYIVGQGGDIFRITVDCTPGPGDENADCRVNILDVPIFVSVLLGNDADSGHIARADVNGDGLVNGKDIAPFTHMVVP